MISKLIKNYKIFNKNLSRVSFSSKNKNCNNENISLYSNLRETYNSKSSKIEMSGIEKLLDKKLLKNFSTISSVKFKKEFK